MKSTRLLLAATAIVGIATAAYLAGRHHERTATREMVNQIPAHPHGSPEELLFVKTILQSIEQASAKGLSDKQKEILQAWSKGDIFNIPIGPNKTTGPKSIQPPGTDMRHSVIASLRLLVALREAGMDIETPPLPAHYEYAYNQMLGTEQKLISLVSR